MTEDNNLAKNVGQWGNVNIRPTAFGGHCLYVRKCMTGDMVGNNPYERALSGIVIPEQSVDQTCYVEILAVGRRVGTRCTEDHARRYRTAIMRERGMGAACATRLPPDELVGKIAYIPLPWPLYDERVKRSPLSDHEFFVEETLPVCVFEEPKGEENAA